jgi:hypothetical protein
MGDNNEYFLAKLEFKSKLKLFFLIIIDNGANVKIFFAFSVFFLPFILNIVFLKNRGSKFEDN